MTFLSPFYIYLLPLSLIPIIIHLIFKRKPKLIEFSNVPFLEDLLKITRRRTKLKNLLLLLARCLMIFLLILIFSRPVIHHGAISKGKVGKTKIMLDASYSMKYFELGKTKFDRAKELCRDILDVIHEDTVEFIVFSNKIENHIRAPKSKILSMLAELKPTYFTTDLSSILPQIAEENSRILVISDMVEHVFQQQKHVLKDTELIFIAVGKETENAYISLHSKMSGSKIASTISSNFSKPKKISVSIFDGEEHVSEDRVSLSPNSSVSYSKVYHATKNHGCVKISHDNLQDDDVFYFASGEAKKAKVLVISNDIDPSLLTAETYFLNQALTIGYEVENAVPENVRRINVKDFDVVIIAGISTLKDIPDFDKLIIFLGEKIDPLEYNSRFNINIGSLVKKRQNLSWVDENHPIFLDLKVKEFEYKKITSEQAYSIDPREIKTIAKISDFPFICEKDNLIIVNAALNAELSNFIIKPIFPVFIRAAVNYLIHKDKPVIKHNLYVGESIQRILPKFCRVEIINPLGQKDLLFTNRLNYTATSIPGIYTVKMTIDGKEMVERYSVNVESEKESKLDKLSLRQLKRLFPESDVHLFDDSPGVVHKIKGILYGREVNSELIFILICVMLAEFLLSNPFKSVFKKTLLLLIFTMAFPHQNYFVFTQFKYDGDWDPYPYVHNDIIPLIHLVTSIKALNEKKVVTFDDPRIFSSHFIILFGAGDFPKLKDSEIENLRQFLYAGGTIYIEDTSGERASKFDKRIREEFKRILPNLEFKPLPSTHPVFRAYYLLRHPVGRKIVSKYIEGIDVDGRTAVVYSRNDAFGAIAKDRFGNYIWGVYPGGEKQRDFTQRFLINLIVFSVTGTYKLDYIHQPFIEEKLKLQR